MFRSYIDDSGVQDRRVCGMGGFVGSPLQMDRLHRKWDGILTKFKVPKDQGFHSNQFFHHEGCFKGWNEAMRRAFLNNLLDAIYHSRVIAVACMVDVAYFKSLSEDERRWVTGGYRGRQWDSEGSPSNPYFFAFHTVVIGAAHNTPLGEKVAFTFDRQKQYERKARMSYDDMLQTTPDHVRNKLAADIIFSDRFSAVVLQAADLMAYQAYRHVVRRIENSGNDVPQNYVLKQLRRHKSDLKLINKESVKRLLDNFHALNPRGFVVKRGKKKKQFRIADGR